jgi:hypothetical protein
MHTTMPSEFRNADAESVRRTRVLPLPMAESNEEID